MSSPLWILSLIYWLHMLASVVWVGGLAALTLITIPAARRALSPPSYGDLLVGIQRRMDPFGWACLLILVVTGMFQLSSSPNYQGLLSFTNRWAITILIKHIMFLCMVGVSATLTWGVLPAMSRMAIRLSVGLEAPEVERLRRIERLLLRLNFILGGFVLALTALARVS